MNRYKVPYEIFDSNGNSRIRDFENVIALSHISARRKVYDRLHCKYLGNHKYYKTLHSIEVNQLSEIIEEGVKFSNISWGNFIFEFEIFVCGEELTQDLIIHCSSLNEDKWDISFDCLVLEVMLTRVLSDNGRRKFVRDNPFLNKMVKSILINTPSILSEYNYISEKKIQLEHKLSNLVQGEFELNVSRIKYGRFNHFEHFWDEYYEKFTPYITEHNEELERTERVL